MFLSIIASIVLVTNNFPASKVFLHKNIFVGSLQTDYYCGCKYNRERRVDINSCGYKIRKNATRALRIEWEHVVPASVFGRTLECWKHGGRKNCSRTSKQFVEFEKDLHNLRPVIGEVNSDRSNLPYGIADQTTKTYGQCQFKIDFQRDVAEPPDHIKGDLARITLYMMKKYKIQYEPEFVELMEIWNELDPVDQKEILINKMIKQHQGDSNWYIEKAEDQRK